MCKYQNLTEVFHNGKLVVKDNVLIQPDLIPIRSIGIMEDFTHQGSLIFYSTKAGVDKHQIVLDLLERSKGHGDIEVGISVLEEDGFIVRALGQGGEALHSFFLEVQDFLWEHAPVIEPLPIK